MHGLGLKIIAFQAVWTAVAPGAGVRVSAGGLFADPPPYSSIETRLPCVSTCAKARLNPDRR